MQTIFIDFEQYSWTPIGVVAEKVTTAITRERWDTTERRRHTPARDGGTARQDK